MTRINALNTIGNIGLNRALYITGGIALLFGAILFKPFAIVNCPP